VTISSLQLEKQPSGPRIWDLF